MCGITGFIEGSCRKKTDELEIIIKRMTDTLRHRGPDDKGSWTDENAGIALGHRRLSIIDISQEGHQPMVSVGGRYVIVFNGEIYNFKTLRKDLESNEFRFRSHSDTEVMLAAISFYGVEKAVEKFNGMFAFSLWDRQEKTLYLCRDRLGEKPLYYGFINNSFVFASELKAFNEFPGFEKEIDRHSLTLYLRYNCIPAPYSIYRNLKKVLPGELISFQTQARNLKARFYWSALGIARASHKTDWIKSPQDSIDEAEVLLKDAVKIRMESDVPLGVFLSGGIDSSLVTALMQAQSNEAVKTFTIGFGDPRYNEAKDARKVAQYLGTAHTSFYATAGDALKVIPELPGVYDEPFADSSQIPTILVSRMAKEYVTVCLSGDGGDEIFAGYNRYIWLEKIWQKLQPLPYSLRKALANFFSLCSSDRFENFFEKTKFLLPGHLKLRNSGIKFQKFLEVLAALNVESAYLNLTSHWKQPENLVLGLTGRESFDDKSPALFLNDLKRLMMYYDMTNYLPNDILVKVDRASMSASLESRAVYLDHRLVEFAWKLPVNMLINKTGSKLILRAILKKYLPVNYWQRPKMGFAVPIDNWLRGPLKNWADDLLSSEYLKKQGFFDHRTVQKKWQEHISGKKNWQFELWDILMFNSWLEFNGIKS